MTSGIGALICALLLIAPVSVRAAANHDASAIAARMSEQSFALLGSLNAQTSGGATSPLLGPVASFSSDVETLKSALAKGDHPAAGNAVRSLESDSGQIETALRSNLKAIKAEDWNSLKTELEQVARLVPASAATTSISEKSPATTSSGPATVATGSSASSAPEVPSSAAAAAPVGVPAPPLSAPPLLPIGGAPEISISSRTAEGDVVHIKGYIRGTGLKAVGIYEHGQQVKAFDVGDVPGAQRINLDIGIGTPPPDTVIRVVDAHGRSAEALVNDAETLAPPLASEIPPGVSSEGSTAAVEAGSALASAPISGDSEGGGTVEEIPSHGPPRPSPSHRHTLGTRLADAQIDILGVTQVTPTPPMYRVVGQIDGKGVTRAGIYVDGRLVKRIPVIPSASFQPFDQRFTLQSGSATIRAYSVGNVYIDKAIDMSNGSQAVAGAPSFTAPFVPMVHASAPGVGVQITDVHPLAHDLYAVSGTISGSNIASAGLYQNGVLAQAIKVSSGGALASHGIGLSLGGLLGGLTPGAAQTTTFTGTFNPTMGPASVRAYDHAGAYTEQSVPVFASDGTE